MKSLLDFLNESTNDNFKRLSLKLKAGEPFMVVGKPGSGKEALVKSVANDQKMELITVYLDKMEPEDLDGFPVKKDGKIFNLLPDWAKQIADNKNKKYVLLFSDDHAEVSDDLWNALMPIVLKHEIAGQTFDNIIVGIAVKEITNISKPILSKVKPIIEL